MAPSRRIDTPTLNIAKGILRFAPQETILKWQSIMASQIRLSPAKKKGLTMGSFSTVALQGSIRGLSSSLLLGFLLYTTTSGLPACAADGSAACRSPVARVVSIQGTVEIQASGQVGWSPVTRLDTPLCDGDRLRTGPASRSALFVQPESLVRVDRNTTIAINQLPDETLIEFFQDELRPVASNSCGAGYFISRFPKKFKVKGPHLSAAVEGTEFLVALSCESDLISVFEGKVLASQTAGNGQSVLLEAGQTATAGPGEAPVIKLNIKPEDAVQWVVYYPPITPPDANIEEDCRPVASDRRASCLIARAERLLRAGHVDEARNQINDAIAVAPLSSDAKALQSIISLVRNEKSEALRFANEAVAADSKSAPAWLALSYAQQSDFKLEAALASAQKAVEITPNNSLALARVAELQLSLGWDREAEKTAKQAVAANDAESRAHMILGFVHLAQIKVKEARGDFERAIELDSTDPLSRLGLGLAIIRTGKLVEGREQIEISVALDPTNSLIRSYVGKAYYEENSKERDQLAATQFELAKQLDPNDPTPWFYGAILKETQNQTIEALDDLQKSIVLNNNRAVYRSRLALDQDLASRNTSLARIYGELGFTGPATVQAAKSLSIDPSNASAYRFLADTYSMTPAHEIARASTLLQAQLRDPLNSVPLQSQLANDQFLFLVEGLGPSHIGSGEYNPLFQRNSINVNLHAIYGDDETRGQQVIVSSLQDAVSVALSESNLETKGQWENGDSKQETYVAYFAVQASPQTSFQGEIAQVKKDYGNLVSFFDPTIILSDRNDEKIDSFRIGLRHKPTPKSEILFSFVSQDALFALTVPALPTGSITTQSYKYELQNGFGSEYWKVVWGTSYFDANVHEDFFGFLTFDSVPTHFNAYGYGYLALPSNLLLQVGFGYDRLETRDSGFQEKSSPKLGVIWEPVSWATLRAASFDVLKRRITSDQGLEPTQLAGFNQYFDDPNGTGSEGWGVAAEVRPIRSLFTGVEYSRRQLSVPLTNLSGEIEFNPRDEEHGYGYVQWLLSRYVALSAEVYYDVYRRSEATPGIEGFLNLEQYYTPVGVKFFASDNINLNLTVGCLRQKGRFFGSDGSLFDDQEDTTLMNIALRYRLPRRMGSASLEVRNVLDKEFRYQSTNLSAVPFSLERSAFARLSLRF